jgi:hypothetical protein
MHIVSINLLQPFYFVKQILDSIVPEIFGMEFHRLRQEQNGILFVFCGFYASVLTNRIKGVRKIDSVRSMFSSPCNMTIIFEGSSSTKKRKSCLMKIRHPIDNDYYEFVCQIY